MSGRPTSVAALLDTSVMVLVSIVVSAKQGLNYMTEPLTNTKHQTKKLNEYVGGEKTIMKSGSNSGSVIQPQT